MEHAKVTRTHRMLAVRAMYPECSIYSPMWQEFVEGAASVHDYRATAAVAQAIADAEVRGPVISMAEFENGLYVRCVSAADGFKAAVGRCGYLYSASEALHGPGATWIWNMEFSGGMAECPVRDHEGYVFARMP